jgi:HAMP domain-containing protein
MRLSAKWFMWFTGIGVYVMFLGGIFYYNLFKWTFDEKLKQEAIDMVRLYAPTLINGLSKNQSAISMDEYDTVTRFAKDDRVAALLYLNKYGEVRWFKDPTKITETFDQFQKEVTLPTDAIEQAWLSKSPIVRAVPNLPLYDIAIPLALRGDIMGILDIQVSREGVVKVINAAMQKYAVGAVGVLLLLGIPLYFFLHHFVLGPLMALRDAVESISFKTLELKYPPRADEVGDVAVVINTFLSKVRAEIANAMVKEKQRGAAEARWWQSILLAIVSKNHRAIVVDEDNSVLYTNFATTGNATGDGKLHLLDVIDSQQQDVLRLVGVALDRPNQLVESDTTFKGDPCHVKAVHLEEEGELKRTLILFEVRNGQPPKF